ncbi:MAG TPA: ribonuclease H-like domain-containing protein [Candidatus Magasanikbacteria bacterium]|nr:ribonuclease H-like domain-containing protein [Candidatus Magasanikbacteria bacterium]
MLNEIVFDIETQNTFAEVENDFKKLKVSVVSIYSYATDTYQSFSEDELSKLWPILEKADRLIGYNSEHFDLPVLNNYYLGNLLELPSLDLLKKIKESLGIRLKLSDVAEATLDNITKSADGLQAIKWWKEGKIDEIKKYCEQDVRVTKELYDFGRTNNQLFYKNLVGEVLPFAVDFSFPNDQKEIKKSVNFTLPF